MDMLETIRKEAKPFEVKAMADIVLKESQMLKARSEAIQTLAHSETDLLKMIEYCAEVAMINRLIHTLETISKETLSEAERLGMTKD